MEGKSRDGCGRRAWGYGADGVEREVVKSRVQELMDEKKEKNRFALPRPGIYRKEILRSVFGGAGLDFGQWKYV